MVNMELINLELEKELVNLMWNWNWVELTKC